MIEIPLNHSKFAIIDDLDADLVAPHHWYAYKNSFVWYARAEGHARGSVLLMHRVVLGLQPGEIADHINGDGLDNRRQNLRRCTNSQNQAAAINRGTQGTSRYRGVHWRTRAGRWKAQIGYGGKLISLGEHHSQEAAARAYDRAALHYYGEFARPNFSKDRP